MNLLLIFTFLLFLLEKINNFLNDYHSKDKTIQCESGGILLKGEASRKELMDVMTN